MSVQSALYYLARRAFSQERRNRIKRVQQRLRGRLQWLYRARYGTFSADELRRELARRLGDDFEVLFVHSAFEGLTPMFRDSVADLKRALIELCGPGRTLAMPAFVFGGWSFDPAGAYRRRPLFDARRAPSEMGLLTEVFRRHPGVRRSLHPTHSVCALGPLAEELVAGHEEDDYGCGDRSPFAAMDRHRTVILGLGVPYFRALTHVHRAEQLLGAGFPVPFTEERVPVVVKDAAGAEREHLLRVKTFGGDRRIGRVRDFLAPGELAEWSFHGVRMYAVPARRVTEALVEAARRGRTIYTAGREDGRG
jgi:aminoglycoside N3'-acetyltransferase